MVYTLPHGIPILLKSTNGSLLVPLNPHSRSSWVGTDEESPYEEKWLDFVALSWGQQNSNSPWERPVTDSCCLS